MKKLITVLLTSALLIANFAYADDINVGGAWKDAFILVSLKFVLAYVVFYILTLGLRGKEKDTALKNGRWFGAILTATFIATTTTLHKSNFDLLVGGAFMAVVWFLIGFTVGFVWKKIRTKTIIFNKKYYIFIALIVFSLILFFTIYNKDTAITSNIPNQTSPINSSTLKPKLGNDWNWHHISEKWWIVDDSYQKNKYGFVNVWLKIEIMDVAKKEGENYSHTIVNAVFSCNDKNFKFNSITHIYDKDYIDDKVEVEDLNAYINFRKLDDNANGLANTYHYVCDR
jgi:hypothetical protein